VTVGGGRQREPEASDLPSFADARAPEAARSRIAFKRSWVRLPSAHLHFTICSTRPVLGSRRAASRPRGPSWSASSGTWDTYIRPARRAGRPRPAGRIALHDRRATGLDRGRGGAAYDGRAHGDLCGETPERIATGGVTRCSRRLARPHRPRREPSPTTSPTVTRQGDGVRASCRTTMPTTQP
jgi:hypothetical protein